MSTPIPDPFDPERAVLPNGRLGHRIRFIASPVNPERITMTDLSDAIYLGYTDADFGPLGSRS